MANRGFEEAAHRLDFEGGPAGTQRRRPAEPTGEPMADVKFASRAETRGDQYRRGGWDKYEVPAPNADAQDLPEFFARGGNAGAGHNEAAYPGGTTA
jgi:hypothetical protein